MPDRAVAVPKGRLALLAVCAAVVLALLFTHTSQINGPWYWKWPWQTLPWSRLAVGAGGIVPFVLAQYMQKRRVLALILLVLCGLQFRLSSCLIRDPDWSTQWLVRTIRHPSIVSYFNDAGAIGTDPNWLADYPKILPLTSLHTQSKPPGPVAYYLMWIRLLGYTDRAALWSGMGLITIQSLVVVLVYLLACEFLRSTQQAFLAASLYSLCPAAILITPQMDPAYAGWTCVLLIAWNQTLRRDSILAGLITGILTAAGLFFSYSLLLLGPLVLFLTFAWCPSHSPGTPGEGRGEGDLELESGSRVENSPHPNPAPEYRRRGQEVSKPLLRATVATLIGIALMYGSFWLITGFNPIATFHSAWNNQHLLLTQHANERPYPMTILFDLTDFALGLGWVGVLIAAMAVLRACIGNTRMLVIACLGEPVFIAVSGLMQSETFRVWNFLVPLLLLPAAIELSYWPVRTRWTAYTCMLLVLLAEMKNLNL